MTLWSRLHVKQLKTAENSYCNRVQSFLWCSTDIDNRPRSSAARFKIPLHDLPGHGTWHIPGPPVIRVTGEQGWSSDESASSIQARCHMWVESAVVGSRLVSRFFLRVFRFSSVPLQKPTFSDFNSTRIENLYENQLRLMCRALLRTFARKFSNIDFFLKILPLKDDELVMSET